ncbi:MFS transporter [Amycolatopsis taiwanensis]|uniref:MFS transporter n=2 Tax=Amycolatopsis taiwanensis TaxID=342230 RepID=A0A9W6R4U6_9PSEU|nr:MFS transporter [Amycolatopsis taiwanensis]
MTASAQSGAAKVQLRSLATMPGFPRLLLSRFAAQWSDGVFRAGLAGAVLFNPERGTDPLTIAAGFAVLLLPYSLIGPFAGALLDRWDRRRVLIVANLLRGLAVAGTASAVGFGVAGPGLFVLALIVEGISRFIGSGMSASLPHVVPVNTLVTANAVSTTLGSVVSVLGGGCAIGLRALLGTGNTGSAWTTSIAVVGAVVAAAIAVGFARGRLGPEAIDEPADPLIAVARGFADGARAAMRVPMVTAGFVALFAHRASYGISLLLTVLLMRFSFTDLGPFRAGLPGLGQMAFMAGAGILLAGFCTPRLVAVLGRRRVTLAALLSAAAAQAGLGLPMVLPTVLIASFVITFAGQVLKLCVDSSIQAEIGDQTRGRVFALYDTLFNITQVAAVAAAAAVTPLSGRSPLLLLVATAIYLIGCAGYLVIVRRGVQAS